MKVELQCGDTIAIPEGCKAIVKDGSVVFEKELQEFDDGDVLRSVYSDTMLIFKEYEKGGSIYFYSHYNTEGGNNKNWNSAAFRHATEGERRQLFVKMKEQGLWWNAEKKRVEKIRWRAKEGERYYALGRALESVILFENGDTYDDDLWNALNHFRTEEQTKEAARRVKETLRKYHEEIGE